MHPSTHIVLILHPAIFAKKSILLLARVLHIAVCPGNSRAKQQKPQQRRLTMFFPILPIATGIIGYSIIQKIRDI